MPPLRERFEDVELLLEYFTQNIKGELMIERDIKISTPIESIELTHNIKSLRAFIYKKLILSNLSKDDIEDILYEYLYKNLKGNNSYREIYQF